MRWKPIIIFCILVFLIVLIVFVIYKYSKTLSDNETNMLQNLKKKRIELSSKYYGDKSNRCNSYTTADSQGLLLDESIVCNALKNLRATPYFYFEEFNNDSNMNDWIFVNLDCTFFNKFKNKNSPQNILCKNMETLQILSKALPNKNLLYIGFTSIDKFNPNIKKNYRKIIHIAGKSPSKGTKYIVSAWLSHPEWPVLTIICNNKMSVVDNINYLIKDKSPKNIILIKDFIPENELIRYMNEYGIHICTSEFEGFGHNSNEARSVEAVTLYTDMPCFQERFKDGINGIAVKSIKNGFVNNICPKYIPTKDGIENAINKIMFMSEEELSKIGKQARQDFLIDDSEFKLRLVSLVKGDNSIPYIIHNMWISKYTPFENVKMPEKYNKNMKTLYENNKNFEFKYWSGKDILNLIKDYFPEYLDFYIQLEPNICKCDFARFIVVALYGGLYIDLDFYCKKNLSELLTGDSYFVYEPKEHFKNGIYLSNGFFAACKNNKFVLGWIDQMKKNKNIPDVLRKTGPIGLCEYYKNNKNKVLFGDTCDVISIIDTNELSKQCSGKYNNYATTLWYEGSQWGGTVDPPKPVKFKKIKNPIDGSEMLWEENNIWNELELKENNVVFNNAKNNNYNYGVIYISNNLCDLSIPLALALKNIGRSDITVYVIDSSQDKCDFVEKMSLINSVSNIKILNYDLKRVSIDDLFKKGEIGYVGIYYFSGDNDIINGSKNLINICNPIIISN